VFFYLSTHHFESGDAVRTPSAMAPILVPGVAYGSEADLEALVGPIRQVDGNCQPAADARLMPHMAV